MAVSEERKTGKAGRSKPKAAKVQSGAAVGELKVTLIRSVIGRPRTQREVVKGLGLRRVNSSVIRKDCPEIQGMIRKIPHLLKVEALEKK